LALEKHLLMEILLELLNFLDIDQKSSIKYIIKILYIHNTFVKLNIDNRVYFLEIIDYNNARK